MFVGLVDITKSHHKGGELIGHTKLAYVDEVQLDVPFSYASPLNNGDYLTGTITLVKKNGSIIEYDIDCENYLKYWKNFLC